MRVPQSNLYLNFLHDLELTQERMAEAQSRVSTGKKVIKPSDDPTAATDIVKLTAEKAEAGQFEKNLSIARSRLDAADTALDSVEKVVERARTLALSSLSSPSTAHLYTAEVTGLRDQVLSTANITNQGRFIFGGSANATAPFVKAADSTISYQGNSTAMFLQVGRLTTLQAEIPGSEIFTGPVDIFATLKDLVTAMQVGDQDAIGMQAQKLDEFLESLSTARSRVGSYINVADSLAEQMGSAELSRETQLHRVQSADPAQAITELTLSQTSLQATLATGARLSQLTLLDFLN
jgi:flagellar hook-associated protein 3 FlgL